ncbi:MAG: hypothetical protein JW863_10145 [Chitinispirillaceae bacterium]|nr:hypothetical protein [Chitinispirillaceae bacterium]
MKPSSSLYCSPLFFILFCFQIVYSSATTLGDLSERRAEITQQLDSLDLLKQNLKREGIAITEVELRQSRLRDSLNYLRSRIQSTSEAPSPSGNRNPATFLKMPSNLFDWIIVIVGGVAFFSGLMLVIGISRSVSSRKRRSALKKYQRQAQPQQSAPKEVETKPEPAYPSPDPAPPPPATSGESMNITSLRQRIAHSADHAEENHMVLKEAPRHSIQPRIPENSTDDTSLEKQVIAAANDGMDTLAISRKFHISVDHVDLLLKMAPRRK